MPGPPDSKTVLVCVNFRPFGRQPSCAFRGSKELADLMEAEIAERDLPIVVERTKCLGHCPHGPNVRVLGGDFVHEATPEKVRMLLDELSG